MNLMESLEQVQWIKVRLIKLKLEVWYKIKAGGGMTRPKKFINLLKKPKNSGTIFRKAKLVRSRWNNYMNKGGKVRNRNIGGVIGGGLNSQDVVDYLYKYKS